MEKITFNKIITNYENIAKESDEFIEMFNDNFDLENLTIKELKELIVKARNLQSKSDNILRDELYHLLGMGNLTAIQTQKLCSVTKKIANSRSYFKPVAVYVLNKLPEVPDKSSYKCGVAGIKLESIFK